MNKGRKRQPSADGAAFCFIIPGNSFVSFGFQSAFKLEIKWASRLLHRPDQHAVKRATGILILLRRATYSVNRAFGISSILIPF